MADDLDEGQPASLVNRAGRRPFETIKPPRAGQSDPCESFASFAVADRGMVLRRWGFCDQHGELLCEIDPEDFWNGVGPFIGIERAMLQQALLIGASGLPCRLGSSVIALQQDHDGVSICFSDGSRGRYDLVVGADGISSSIRDLAFGANPPAGAGHFAWRSVVPGGTPPPAQINWSTECMVTATEKGFHAAMARACASLAGFCRPASVLQR